MKSLQKKKKVLAFLTKKINNVINKNRLNRHKCKSYRKHLIIKNIKFQSSISNYQLIITSRY